MSNTEGEFGLLDPEGAEGVGDEWEEIDVSDTEADRVARKRDREFNQFRKRIKDADQFKVEASVFDEATLLALYQLVHHGHLQAFGGPISTGKEANVYEAMGADEQVAVKIYRINASDFKDMREYLIGDPRFEELGGDKKRVVLAWTRKEYANLERARKAGVRVPKPIAVERNVLVMEYIATDGERAKRLNEVEIENPETAYNVVREYMRRLDEAGLVHGDLSEYNIVFHDGQLVFLDMGQAVTVHHPNSEAFLRRDCENVVNFFARQGLETDADDLYAFVTGESVPEE
ncbi:serine/threonine-protein kinase Rio1 [Halalkalicoccus jeotgali]|uniref:non-specific serine/threonine protein kinase n=1 Tax=Halalkalicoccus jeotgali (strain DSM 18796 / CECT 7217 / JCM 14584 / KCTC 4019 / B3) TaxID=795797 RepID=D8J824_HALJB|nr:serine/threonine-protein kinase Rio1 [Halalkalicoccus jeotgali]ADJ14137.1 RIO-like kinase [Halalkalicoccus jeotgali B3]ELY34681.1 RIO-like kinase [Halalkalicoccus jeotgali B3]